MALTVAVSQLALLVRRHGSNDVVVFKGFLAVVLLPSKYSLFLRVKPFKVQSDFFFFFRLACRNITSNRIRGKKKKAAVGFAEMISRRKTLVNEVCFLWSQ